MSKLDYFLLSVNVSLRCRQEPTGLTVPAAPSAELGQIQPTLRHGSTSGTSAPPRLPGHLVRGAWPWTETQTPGDLPPSPAPCNTEHRHRREMFQPSPRPEPLQEPLSKLTLIFVASFPGSSCGDAFSCWEEQGGEGDQRGKRNCQLGWEGGRSPPDPCPPPGWLPGARRKRREKGEGGCSAPASPGTQGRWEPHGAAGKGTAAPEHHGSRGVDGVLARGSPLQLGSISGCSP